IHLSTAFMLEPPNGIDHIPRSSSQKLELQLSSSFASLAVLRREVIGVVVKDVNRGNPLQAIVTCTPQTGEEVPVNGVMPGSDGQKASVSTKATLVSPGIPRKFKKFKKERMSSTNKGNVLDSYIKEVLQSQGCQYISLDDHIWMLQKILNTRSAQDIDKSLQRLLLYVVIACFRKLSQRTCHFLKNGPFEEYDYKELKAIDTKPTTATSFYNKETFRDFHHMLLSILDVYRNALGQMKNATEYDGPSQETFGTAAANIRWAGDLLHRLTTGAALPMHLQTIRKSLSVLGTSNLSKSRGEEAGVHPVQGKAGIPLRDGDLIKSQDSSEDVHAIAGTKAYDLDNTADNDHDGEPEDEDEDEDCLEEIRSPAGHQAALKWIKLLVSQFSSAHMLIYGLQNIRVSFQILKSPQVGRDFMPWKELLADKNFFPARPSMRGGSRLWSNKQITSFLDKGLRSNRRPTLNFAHNAYKTWQGLLATHRSSISQPSSVYQPLFDRMVEIVSQMHDQTTVPGCQEAAQNILRALRASAASGITVDIMVESARTTQVTRNLLHIIEVCRIFNKLAPTKFSGSLHCQVALGTLISTPINEALPQYSSLLAKLQEYGPVIGSSKDCCAVCARLLSITSPLSSSQSFVTKGSHRTITPCTLPDWTPPHVVKQMIDYFGASLREEIGRLMERTNWAPFKHNP
ncbi:hypothetical protein GALMADRAFT_49554, partial [Galerina marginata CBS 339.88]